MSAFLLWIGAYNALGSVLLMVMHFDIVADAVLRRGTEMVKERYEHQGFSRMFLWWAAMVNLFMGAVMVRAAKWPFEIQKEVTLFAIGVYLIGWLAGTIGMRPPRYGRGRHAIHPLWLGQAGWGAWALWQGVP